MPPTTSLAEDGMASEGASAAGCSNGLGRQWSLQARDSAAPPIYPPPLRRGWFRLLIRLGGRLGGQSLSPQTPRHLYEAAIGSLFFGTAGASPARGRCNSLNQKGLPVWPQAIYAPFRATYWDSCTDG